MNKILLSESPKEYIYNIDKLFEYLEAEVYSAGGDGDCLVLCKCYDAKELANNMLKFIQCKNNSWDDFKIYEDADSITIYTGQESWRFTNNLKEEYPDWSQCVVKI